MKHRSIVSFHGTPKTFLRFSWFAKNWSLSSQTAQKARPGCPTSVANTEGNLEAFASSPFLAVQNEAARSCKLYFQVWLPNKERFKEIKGCEKINTKTFSMVRQVRLRQSIRTWDTVCWCFGLSALEWPGKWMVSRSTAPGKVSSKKEHLSFQSPKSTGSQS